MEDSYKSVNIQGDDVIIKHFIREEYNDQDFASTYTFEQFKAEILGHYNIGASLNLMEILEIKEDTIITKMPKYEMLIDNKQLFTVNKLKNLITFLKENNIYHNDLAFRNIGIDKQGNFQLIDLSSLTHDDYYKINFEGDLILYGNNYYLEDDVRSFYKSRIFPEDVTICR